MFELDSISGHAGGGMELSQTFPTVDPYRANRVLLAHFDTSLTLDSSISSNTASVTGTPSLSTPAKFGTNAASFPGAAGNYVEFPSIAAYSLGTGNFTIHAWVKVNSAGTYNVLGQLTNAGGSLGWIVNYIGGAFTYNLSSNGSTWDIVSGASMGAASTGAYHLVSLIRNGNTVTPYIDGIAGSGVTTTSLAINGTGPIGVGAIAGGSFNGSIDELTIIKGASEYTTNFIPPSAPTPDTTGDLYRAYRSLLLHFDNNIVDSSPNPVTFTTTGAVSPSSTQSKFGGFSLFQSGSNNGTVYFTSTNTSALAFSGNFSISFWCYLASNTTATFLDCRKAGGANSVRLQFGTEATGKLNYIVYNAGVTAINVTAATSTVPLNTWTHVAVIRSSNVVKMYLNGVADANTASDSLTHSPEGITIGSTGNTIGYNSVNGYIDEFTVINGVAEYTSNFTPPTAPVSNIGQDLYRANRVLLAHFDASLTLDSSPYNNTGIVTGSPTLNASSKLGSNCVSFPGTAGNVVTFPNIAAYDLGTSNFTIQFWVFLNATGNQYLLANTVDGANLGWGISDFLGRFNFYLSSNGTSWDIASDAPMNGATITGQWVHLALVRNGNVFTPYVNGVAGTTVTSSASIFGGRPIRVGNFATTGGSPTNGRIDEVTISKVAEYTSNFTPPAEPTPDGLIALDYTNLTDFSDLKNSQYAKLFYR